MTPALRHRARQAFFAAAALAGDMSAYAFHIAAFNLRRLGKPRCAKQQDRED